MRRALTPALVAGDAGDGADRGRQVRSKLTPALASKEFSTLKWARSYIQIHSPQSRVEIDRLEPDSKFFRSLVVISVALTMYFVFDEKKVALAATAFVLGALSYLRYVDQRWKATELSYATLVILNATKSSRSVIDPSET